MLAQREEVANARDMIADRREVAADAREQIADRREAAADARDERLDARQGRLSAGAAEDSVTQSTWEAIERARTLVALGARRRDRNVAASLRCESREVRQQGQSDRNVANARRRSGPTREWTEP